MALAQDQNGRSCTLPLEPPYFLALVLRFFHMTSTASRWPHPLLKRYCKAEYK